MSEIESQKTPPETEILRAEIARLNKVVNALMDRAERSGAAHGSDFDVFRTTIMLEEQVRLRTEELETVIREKEKILRALWKSEGRFRGIVNQPLVGICIIEDGSITYTNPKFAEMFGYSAEEILRIAPIEIAADRDKATVIEQMRRRLSGEVDKIDYTFHGLRKNGALINIECHSSVMNAGEKKILISMMLDITERVQAELEVKALQDRLRELAIRDPLTGLYNRLPLNEFFDREISTAKRYNAPISVVIGDLDNFKMVNDSYGHMAGDQTLQMFAHLIQRSFRGNDVFCRYGGEEFLILLPETAASVACERTEHLRQTLEKTSVVYGASRFHVTASFGVSTFPQHGQTRCELIAAADHALYAAKHAGRNQVKSCSETPDFK